MTFNYSGKDRTLPAVFLWLLLLAGFMIRCTGAGAGAKWPVQPGISVLGDGLLTVDVSSCQEGYVSACASAGEGNRLKLRIEKDEMTLTYDLKSSGEYEVFPLQLGSGTYNITLYKNVGGKKYSQEGKVVLDAALTLEEGAYYYPNQFINYNEQTKALEDADSLCAQLSPKESFDAVCAYMTSAYVYDYIRALTVTAGELPDLDGTWERKMGICQDLSAVMVSMLRSQGVPSRMMIGYADTQYHAWTETLINGEYVLFDPTAELDAISSVKDYSVERWY